MDQNWLMSALQSPEGMNFLNSWRQRYGTGGGANTYGSGSSTPVSRWRIPGTGGPTGSMPGPSNVNPGTFMGGTSVGGIYPGMLPETQDRSQSFSVGGIMRQPQPQPSPASFSVGGNDLAGQQQMPPMPYWNSGN